MAIDPRYQEVHPITVGKDRYEACMAKTRKPHYWAPQRITFPDGSFEIRSVRVPDNMSVGCRNYYLWHTPACAGCTYPHDLEYRDRMTSAPAVKPLTPDHVNDAGLEVGISMSPAAG